MTHTGANSSSFNWIPYIQNHVVRWQTNIRCRKDIDDIDDDGNNSLQSDKTVSVLRPSVLGSYMEAERINPPDRRIDTGHFGSDFS